MKKHLILLMTVIIFSPGFIFSGIFTIKMGFFFPRANSDLWAYEFSSLTFSKSSFQNRNLYVGYDLFLSKRVSLAMSLESYSKRRQGTYKDYGGHVLYGGEYINWALLSDYIRGYKLMHDFRVGITPIQVSLKLYPMGTKTKFFPFMGGGAGIYLWSVAVKGNWIDFNDEHFYYDEDLNVDIAMYPTDMKAVSESKVTIGYQIFGGLMFNISKRTFLDVVFKYNFANGKFSDFFADFGSFDISGYNIFIGINFRH